MRTRPVRPNIFLPVVRFGVADSDWFSVLLISCAGYLAPVPFGITLLYIPLQMWTWLLATAGSVAFFNYIRIGRRPHWLQHQFRSLFFSHRQHRSIPNGRRRGFNRSWIIGHDFDPALSDSSHSSPLPATVNSFMLQHNNLIQEACEERWNALWVMTN
jgi:hypothetical protein